MTRMAELLGIPGLTVEVLVIAVVTALLTAAAGLLFRDAPKAWYRRLVRRRQDLDEWYADTIEYLLRLVQVGSTIQASSEIDPGKLQRITDISEDFVAHVEPKPEGVDEEVYSEVAQIAYLAGWVANLVEDLDEVDTLDAAMGLVADFRRRNQAENISLEELAHHVPEQDAAKAQQYMVPAIDNLDFATQLNIGMQFMEELEHHDLETIEDLEDFPWQVMDDELEPEVRDEYIADMVRGIISVYLIEVPEEAAEMVRQAQNNA